MFYRNAEKGKNKWWSYLLSLLIVIIAHQLGQIPLMIALYNKKERLGMSDSTFMEYLQNNDLTVFGLDENLLLFTILLPFAFAFLGLVLAVKYIHKRPFITVLTGRKVFDWRRAFVGFATWGVLAVIMICLALPAESYVVQFDWNKFLPLLAVAITLMPLQTTIEEALFRGYLFQGVQLLVKNRFIAILIVTLGFALMHTANPEFQQGFLKMILIYLLLSFMLGAIAVLDNGLELSIGVHAANNLVVALLISADDSAIVTPSILRTNMETLMGFLPLLLPVLVLLTFLLLQRIYRWNLSTLFAKGD